MQRISNKINVMKPLTASTDAHLKLDKMPGTSLIGKKQSCKTRCLKIRDALQDMQHPGPQTQSPES